jgi:hypothetical protein
MPNPIKYTAGTESLALKKGNFYIGTGDVEKGPTSKTGYYAGITPPTNGYTIYLNKATQGPSIYVASGATDLINLTNKIAGTNYTTSGQCLSYFATQSDKMVLNRNYENIVTSGMVLNLDAAFLPSYPTTGTTWYDISLSGNNGTLTNGPTFSSANGGSIVFDGVDDYVSIADSNTLSFTNTKITINAWVNILSSIPTSIGNENIIIAKTNYTNGWREWSFFWFRDGYFEFLMTPTADVGNWTRVGGRIGSYTSFNTWYNVVGTSDGLGNGRIYINGILIDTNSSYTTTTQNEQAPVTIGGVINGSTLTQLSNMKIPTVQVYNRSLSPFEVYQNYNSMKSRFGIPDIITSGLTVNLDAGNPYSYNPLNTASTLWIDTTYTTTGVTLINGTSYSGGTMIFDGVDNYAQGVVSNFNVGSINMWINSNDIINASLSGKSLLTLKWDGTLNSEWYIGIGSVTSVLTNEYITILNVSNNSRTGLTDGGSLSANTWYNLTFNVQSNYYEIYINGLLKTSTKAGGGVTQLTNPNTIGIGALIRDNRELFFNGEISNTSIYNRGLSPIEIYQNFNSLKNRYGYNDIITEGLVLNLDAYNPNSYNPLNTGSTTWTDVSGNGNDGTLTNGTYYSGGTMVFDGADDYVKVTNGFTNIFKDSSYWTASIWVLVKSWGSGNDAFPVLISIGSGQGVYDELYLEIGSAGFYYMAYASDFAQGSFTPNLNQIYNLVYMKDGNDFKFYINGTLINTFTGRNKVSTVNGDLWIGRFKTSDYELNGNIYGVQMYKRALSTSEILYNYNSMKWRYGL